MNDVIEHDGIVKACSDNAVSVLITSTSACAACHAKGACNITEKREKVIDIVGSYHLSPGSHVTVLMKKSLAYPAVLLGYVLPLLIVVLSLVIMISCSVAEALAGLLSLLLLVPYYIILKLFRTRIDETFTFTIK